MPLTFSWNEWLSKSSVGSRKDITKYVCQESAKTLNKSGKLTKSTSIMKRKASTTPAHHVISSESG